MQTLDLHQPQLPDLQFVLMVLALSTADLPSINVPPAVRRTVFDRCWWLLHETTPPENTKDRVLDLRAGDEITLQALVETIRRTFDEHGITKITWDHPPSDPTRSSSPEARPLVERLERWSPTPPTSSEPLSSPSTPESY